MSCVVDELVEALEPAVRDAHDYACCPPRKYLFQYCPNGPCIRARALLERATQHDCHTVADGKAAAQDGTRC